MSVWLAPPPRNLNCKTLAWACFLFCLTSGHLRFVIILRDTCQIFADAAVGAICGVIVYVHISFSHVSFNDVFKSVRPAVAFSTLRFCSNLWCASRRMHEVPRHECLFGCSLSAPDVFSSSSSSSFSLSLSSFSSSSSSVSSFGASCHAPDSLRHYIICSSLLDTSSMCLDMRSLCSR